MENKKKILYLITQSEYGGAQRYVFDLANSLKDKYNISVAFGEQGEAGGLADRLGQAGIEYYSLPHLKRSISPLNDLIAFFEIVKLIKTLKPDIVHLNSTKISILGSLAAKYIRSIRIHSHIRIIYSVHGWAFNEPLPAWQKNFYLCAEKFTAKLKDKLICVSEHDRRVALEYKIAPENKLATIHNGIDPIVFFKKEDGGNFINSGYKIISIGNLYKTKGYEYLIQTAKIIKDKNLDFSLVIIGEGQEKPSLDGLIKKLGLEKHVILFGAKNNAARLLPAFDLYACSSVKEGLSYTVIEAMRAGLPIVATNVGGNPELITDGREGLLVSPKDPAALADAIIKLVRDKILAERLGNSARQRSLAEFTLSRMVEATEKLYSSLNK